MNKGVIVWNYDKSVSKMRPLVLKWKNFTIEMLGELHIARKELSKEGRPKTGANAPVLTWAQYCEDIGLTKSTANRWLVGYNPETKQIEYTSAHVSYNTGYNEWYTPPEYIEPVKKVLGEIDLDPASTEKANTVIGAKNYYSIEDDGLCQKWTGNVWMNPPYSSDLIEKFTTKFVEHFTSGDIKKGIVLVNNATETQWFQNLARNASAICFPEGRIKFWNTENDKAAPLQGQALIYFGSGVDVFNSEFETIGLVFHV